MDLCKIALFLLLAAFVFYLVVSLCCGKEGFCSGGGCVVRSTKSGYYPGAGRQLSGHSDCPIESFKESTSFIKQYGCPNYVIDGMDSPETVANFVAKKALEHQYKIRNPCTNPDNLYPAGNPMALAQGGSPDGRFAMTGEQLENYNILNAPRVANAKAEAVSSGYYKTDYDGSTQHQKECVRRQQKLNKEKDLKKGIVNFYEGFETDGNDSGNDKEGFGNEDLTAPVAPCTKDSCGLPLTMFNDKCGDPNTYVYDRQIAVTAKSRTYGLGNYLLGDLPICPAVFRDSYGSQVFTPSARPSSDLNAGALRFLQNQEVNIVNTNGDIAAYRDCGSQSNVSVQYSLAG